MNGGGWAQQLSAGNAACLSPSQSQCTSLRRAALPIHPLRRLGVLPVPGRAGKLRSLTNGAGSLSAPRHQARISGK